MSFTDGTQFNGQAAPSEIGLFQMFDAAVREAVQVERSDNVVPIFGDPAAPSEYDDVVQDIHTQEEGILLLSGIMNRSYDSVFGKRDAARRQAPRAQLTVIQGKGSTTDTPAAFPKLRVVEQDGPQSPLL